ncbi:hypothetical protein [Bacillus alkalicellulosilyticus]|uniref:hypothetical protein n=1 Tax=Alkalihalobacterium alkalicellulosilyticum TaxID=1912214 RepID=UPI000996F7C9|nr:hypothetical protein [Bacillus alkalicellulosilyticus]
MKEGFSTPKTFGEILDHTFRLSKARFLDFFLIVLIIIGPIYAIQALVQLYFGASFFRAVGEGDVWYEQLFSGFVEGAMQTNFVAEILIGLLSLISFIFLPIAQSAIMYAINHIKNKEAYTVSSVIKLAFSRFWPIIGSSILYFLLMLLVMAVPGIIYALSFVMLPFVEPVVHIIFGILLFLISFVVFIFFLVRWSFYLGSVVLDHKAPGISLSWNLTSKRVWAIIGIYIVFTIILTCISAAFEMFFGLLLGNSVLYMLIINLVGLFTFMVISVGYTIIYFDLKSRKGADDIIEMLEDYQDVKN